MKKIKYLLLALLIVSMCFGLCACGGSKEDDEPNLSQEQTQNVDDNKEDESTDIVDDGTVTYSVKVVDENGAPIAGAIVQLCKDACVPGSTNAEGVAEFKMAEDEYKVSFLTLPAGYTYSGTEDTFYFEDGSKEMTITLKAE